MNDIAYHESTFSGVVLGSAIIRGTCEGCQNRQRRFYHSEILLRLLFDKGYSRMLAGSCMWVTDSGVVFHFPISFAFPWYSTSCAQKFK
jgi:hypothetical protein